MSLVFGGLSFVSFIGFLLGVIGIFSPNIMNNAQKGRTFSRKHFIIQASLMFIVCLVMILAFSISKEISPTSANTDSKTAATPQPVNQVKTVVQDKPAEAPSIQTTQPPANELPSSGIKTQVVISSFMEPGIVTTEPIQAVTEWKKQNIGGKTSYVSHPAGFSYIEVFENTNGEMSSISMITSELNSSTPVLGQMTLMGLATKIVIPDVAQADMNKIFALASESVKKPNEPLEYEFKGKKFEFSFNDSAKSLAFKIKPAN
ncbi:hypothetical protein [Brevibacillus sp. SYSU BS000544]|uniref:hypothetical protein n=1 Tax=Brevibacillus sp. SYSU BS000544 TaxID=3416443 RepID=UPI003CE54E9D